MIDIANATAEDVDGMADLLLYKQQLKSAFIAKAVTLFPDRASWWNITLADYADNFRSWLEAEEQNDKSWRATSSRPEQKLIALFGDVIFGKSHDAVIKLAVKSGKSPQDALAMSGLVELVDEIRAKIEHDIVRSNPEDASGEPCPASAIDDNDIMFTLPSVCTTTATITVKASSITDPCQRDILDSILHNTRQTIAANICLLPQEPEEPYPSGLQHAMNHTAMKNARGVLNAQ